MVHALVLTTQKKQIQSLSNGCNKHVANLLCDREICWMSPEVIITYGHSCYIECLVFSYSVRTLTNIYKNKLYYHQPK